MATNGERETLAPPAASIGPAAGAPTSNAAAAQLRIEDSAAAAADRVRSVSAALWMVLVLALGAADTVFAVRRWLSLGLGIGLSLAVVPWAILVLRRDDVELRSSAKRSRRVLAVHLGNIALVVAFLAAKWLAYLRAIRHGGDGYVHSYRNYVAALVILFVVGIAMRGGRGARLVTASTEHPARLMAASFGLLSILGTLLLALPVSVRSLEDISLVDSFFTATSSACVTGLATVNVAETYTFFGQLVICGLIQLGGLGIMVLVAAVTMLSGQRLGVKSSVVMAEMVDARSLIDLKRTVRMIVLYTLSFEAVGVALLYVQFRPFAEIQGTADADGPLAGAGGTLWAAVFHAVSSFCNAGMSNFRGGLSPFTGSFGVCLTAGALVTLGGMGFPVIHELIFRGFDRLRGTRPRRLTLNTRLSLVTTAILLGGLTLTLLALEFRGSFAPLGIAHSANAALFHSAAARTAGFNLVDVAAMRPATLLLTCFAMFIGGNPGSIAGGIKTTTLAVLFAAFRGELRGERPRLFDRALPDVVVRRAMGVAFLSTALVCAVVFLLLLTEHHPPLAIIFESVSAFSTTGASTGITPDLSTAGKIILTVTMLVGRVGPLTMALALSKQERLPAYELPEERVMIG